MYCGVGKVPKGKARGTPEYCIKNNQVRYYGLVAIDPKLLEKTKEPVVSLIKEQLKLKKIEDNAKILIKEVKNIRVILELEDIKPARRKKAEKRLEELLARRDKLIKKLKNQKAIVKELEKEENE